MATITTSLAPNPRRFGFTNLPTLSQEESPVPIAELVFTTQFSAVTLSGVGDDQLVKLTCNLPVGFTYVLIDCRMDLQVANDSDMADWDTIAYGLISTAASGSQYRSPFQGISRGLISALDGGLPPRSMFQFVSLPSQVIIPSGQAEATIVVTIANAVQNSSAGFFTSFVRVLQYNVSQAHHYQVNTPIPVR